MRHLPRHNSRPMMIAALLLVTMLGACRPKSPDAPPAPVPPPPETAERAEAVTPPAAASAVPAMPVADSSSSGAPELSSMAMAGTTSKLGVPADLRYSFEGAIEAGRPVTLHLAVVPRAEGGNPAVSVKEEAGIEVIAAPMTVQKAGAETSYRQQLSITRAADGPAELRVLVTMDMPIGQAHSWFSVPLNPAATAAAKKAPAAMQ